MTKGVREAVLTLQPVGTPTWKVYPIARIVAAVTSVCQVPRRLIFSPLKNNPTVRARRLLVYFLMNHTYQPSVLAVARYVGRDHSSLLLGIRLMKERMQDFADDIAKIEQVLVRYDAQRKVSKPVDKSPVIVASVRTLPIVVPQADKAWREPINGEVPFQ